MSPVCSRPSSDRILGINADRIWRTSEYSLDMFFRAPKILLTPCPSKVPLQERSFNARKDSKRRTSICSLLMDFTAHIALSKSLI